MFVICNGMMRSGSTLQYNIVRGLCERLGAPSIPHGPLDPNTVTDREQVRRLAADRALHIVKMHDAERLFVEMAHEHDIRFPYIYRDVRDVAVSLKNKKMASLDHIVERLDVAMEVYEVLKEAGDAIRTLWQRYEVVTADLPGATRQLADFLELDASDDVVEAVAAANTIEQAKAITSGLRRQIRERVRDVGEHSSQGQQLRQRIRTKKLTYVDGTTLLHYDHISQTEGASGVWRTQLTPDELARLVERYGAWLIETGYGECATAADPA